MKQMMFTKEVNEAMIEVTKKIKDGEGDEDDETPNPPETPKAVENISSNESEADSDKEVPAKDDEPWSDVTTRSGRSGRAPSRLIAEVGESVSGPTKAEDNYYALLDRGGGG
jgi:hypothetical protein